MSSEKPQDFAEWAADWQAETASAARATPAEEIRRHVRRRERLLQIWLVADGVVGVSALAFLGHLALTQPDPIEKMAMSLLAAAVAGICVFEAWNWFGRLRSVALDTSAYLAVALDRSRRLQRSLKAGWPLLAAEALIFTPWVWYQLHGGGGVPTPEQSRFGWGLLIAMLGAGAVALSLLQAWAYRDAQRLEEMRRELAGDQL